MPRPLSEYRVLSFDCYGTLIDWERGIWEALQPLLAANDRADPTTSAALAAFARFEAEHEARTPSLAYPQVLARVHHELARHFGLATSDELDRSFAASIPDWPPFSDSGDALRYLQTRYRLVILSNVDRASFAASARRLGVDFDAVYTAEDIGSYKPDPANFEYLLARLRGDFGQQPGDLLHVAQSLYHDHLPAQRLGLATAWIDRQRLSEGGEWGATAPVEERPTPDFVFFSLAELADAVRGGA